MTSDRGAMRDLATDPAALVIEPREVARLSACGPGDGVAEAIAAAIAEARTLCRPRGRCCRLADENVAALFPEPTPVAEIVRAGDRWAFVATIGAELETRVREYFAAHAFLEAVLLDAAGSVAADGLAAQIERECALQNSSARFSPGYCHWSLRGQEPLLATLASQEIGVTLLPSMLMSPLKSVSGVVVAAAEEALLVPREACGACDARCERRRARFVSSGGYRVTLGPHQNRTH